MPQRVSAVSTFAYHACCTAWFSKLVGQASQCMQGFANTRKHTDAGFHCSHTSSSGRNLLLVFVVFLAMAGWQYKMMNELDRERARSTVGWSKCGPTASGRLTLMLDGNIPLHEPVFISTGPCVAYKWRGAEIMYNPLGLLLVRNDAKSGGVARWMIARPIGSLAFNVDATRVEESLVRIRIVYLSGEQLLEHEYQADTALQTVFGDVKAALDGLDKYTDWDLNTVSLAHGGKALRAVGSVAALLRGTGKGQGNSRAMGRGKGKVMKRPAALKRPAESNI